MFKFLKSRCYNGGSQHKFEPRFEKEELGFVKNLIRIQSLDYCSQDQNPFLKDKYIYDICVWCGKIIKRG